MSRPHGLPLLRLVGYAALAGLATGLTVAIFALLR